MVWHYSVPVRLAGVHFDGDRDHLNELGGAFADNVAAVHSIRIAALASWEAAMRALGVINPNF
jgi:hypothetical protein